MTNEMAFQCMHGHARTCGTLHCVLSEHICYQLFHLCAHLQAPAASSSGAAAEAAAEGEEQAAEATRRPVTYGPHHVPLPRQDFTAFIHAVAKADRTAKGMTRRQKRQRRERSSSGGPGGAGDDGMLEPTIGFEPMTCALRMRCSTS